jgi:hypothetical protein
MTETERPLALTTRQKADRDQVSVSLFRAAREAVEAQVCDAYRKLDDALQAACASRRVRQCVIARFIVTKGGSGLADCLVVQQAQDAASELAYSRVKLAVERMIQDADPDFEVKP